MIPRKIFLLMLAFAAVVLLLCMMQEANAAAVPEYASARRDSWFLRYRIWTALHYGLGLLSVVLSVVSVAHKGASKTVKATLSLSAAVAAAVLTFLNPSPNAKAFHRAWHELDSAILSYQESPTPKTEDLLDAIKRGERSLREAGIV